MPIAVDLGRKATKQTNLSVLIWIKPFAKVISRQHNSPLEAEIIVLRHERNNSMYSGNFFHDFCRLLILISKLIFKEFFQDYHESGKQFRSDLFFNCFTGQDKQKFSA